MSRPASAPLGRLLKPVGDLEFEEAVRVFARSVRAASEADLLVFETFTDLYEMKAALLAAAENSDLPVVATMAFDESGRLLTGADVLTATTLAQSLGADAVGMNCGLGPAQMLGLLGSLREAARVPIAINPNAGLPQIVDGRTTFDVTPESFAADARKLAEGGARAAGRLLRNNAGAHPRAAPRAQRACAPAAAARPAHDRDLLRPQRRVRRRAGA